MKKYSNTLLTTFAFTLLILLAIFIGNPVDNLTTFLRIQATPGLLLTDFLSINRYYAGNLNGFIINLVLTTAISLLVIKFTKTPFEGGVIASLITITGFTFIGKNIINVLPLYLGAILYAYTKKTEIKNIMIPLLLASGFSPIVSFLMFHPGMYSVPVEIRFPLAILVGIMSGFMIPIVAAHAINCHKGLNLYNVGFTMGLLAVGAHGILRSFGIHVSPIVAPITGYPDYTFFLMGSIAIFSLGMVALAFVLDKDVLKKYHLILNETGQLASNFSQIAGQPTTILNMGLLGLLSLTILIPILIWLQIPFLSVMGAGVFTIIGFGAFGKHPLNVIPIFIGTILGFIVISFIDSPFTNLLPSNDQYAAYRSSISIHAYTGAILFATTLAPLSKVYGWKAGVIAGFYHMMIIVIGGNFQGGFNLYNNGWMGGFVVTTTMPVFGFFKERKEAKLKASK